MQLTELYDKPGHLIRRAQQIAVAIFTQECRDLDITPAQYEILLAVRFQPGIDATHLSQLVALDRSSLASALDRLERKNLILRHTDAHDRRLKLIHPAPEGAKLLRSAEDAFARAQKRILQPLTRSEQWQFLRLLEQLVTLNNENSRVPLKAPGKDDA